MSRFFRYFFYFKFEIFYIEIHEILFPVEQKKN